MAESTVTRDFKIPIPRDLGRALSLEPGQRVQLLVEGGELRMIPLHWQSGFGEEPSVPTRQLLEELAALQGVRPVQSIDELYGGWPDDELADGFETALRQWRQAG